MLKVHVFLRIAVCFLFVFVPLRTLDEWFYDQFFSIRSANRNDSSVVLIRVNNANLGDDGNYPGSPFTRAESPSKGNGRTEWQPQLYERLLERLERDEPRLIVFTSYFESVDPKSAPLPYKNILFSAYLNEEFKLVPPPLHLVQGENYGFSNIFPDPDNVVRKAYLVYSSGASLALRSYHRLVSTPIKRNLIDPLYIDFKGRAGSYLTYNVKEVLEGEVASSVLRDKVVLIGREGGRYSEYETPLGRLSKLELQANILDTFLQGREISFVPRYGRALVSAVVVGASVAIILYFPLTLAWVLLLLEALVFLFVSLFLFSFFKVWIGIANPVLCILTTHLLMLGYKLGRQEDERWRIQQESQYLKEMDRFKNNFISLFSHDLKTPIAKIRAITERLLNEHPEFSPDVRESLKNVDRTNGELARLISDILKVTKMETMSLELSRDVIDLNRLVEEAFTRLRFLADEKEITLVLDLEPLFSMEGDRQLIQEVITNLVENAIKYSPRNRRVVVRTHEDDGKVWVSVLDEGEGIPADEIPRVTAKFYRGRGVGLDVKGSGLGLYLSKYFVEMHKGGLEIKSALGKGTEVSFWLPLLA